MKLIKPLNIVFIVIPLLYLQPLFSEAKAADNSDHIIRLATTTSTDNSGLLSVLLPVFEDKTGYRVHVIAVGTGKALRMGRDGDADVLLVHAPAAEKEFTSAGYGVKRLPVMYNDFVLVGPVSNPAGIKMDSSITRAMEQIAEHEAIFVSRGDNSGTHKKERSLWQADNIQPEGKWYREVGQGMGKVLQMAGELDAYTLTDRGTWLAYRAKSPLKIVNQGDPKLFNPYHIIAVNPQRYPDINYQGATALIDWITSKQGQDQIARFKVNDTLLFTPSANARQVAIQKEKP